ncbi:MAG: hypothetical protein M3Q03_06750 [Chloroflexota bacterium]|nr:hypothetical protein [Chloroflexota bacterium]
MTPEQLQERVRWAVQTDNRPAMYAYLQVIDHVPRQVAHYPGAATATLRDKGSAGIAKAASASRLQAGRLQSDAEGRQQQAAADEFPKRHGLVGWAQSYRVRTEPVSSRSVLR